MSGTMSGTFDGKQRGRLSTMISTQSFRRFVASGALAIGLGVAALSAGLAFAQADTSRVFSDTGFTVADDAIWGFFSQYGGAATFGEPISREFTLLGKPVQLFQNAAVQVQPDGPVQSIQLTDPGLPSPPHLTHPPL